MNLTSKSSQHPTPTGFSSARRHAAEHAIAKRLARIGVDGAHAELAHGLVTIVVRLGEHNNAVATALDTYAITWRFE